MALAERCGLLSSYTGYDGKQRVIPDSTRERLLSALGLDVSSEERAQAALQSIDQQQAQPGLAPVRVVRAGAHDLRRVDVRLAPGTHGPVRYRLEIALEDGHRYASEGEHYAGSEQFTLALPPAAELQFGYHSLHCELDVAGRRWSSSQDLIVAPPNCLQLFERIGQRRAVGVWTHLYSVHSARSWGVGDLTDLTSLVEWAAHLGLEFVGINPLHATDNAASEVSPYYTLSRLYRNPIYLDPRAAVDRVGSLDGSAWLATPALSKQRSELQALKRVDYAQVSELKRPVLLAAYRSFAARHLGQSTALGIAYADYRKTQGQRLQRFAIFTALREHFVQRGGAPDWHAWPVEYRDAASPAVAAFAEEQREKVEFQAYLQFEFEHQLAQCARTAHDIGMPIGLYGDLALGDAPFSADVWARPDLYANGANVGAPPDPYSDRGQDWGLAPFNPLGLRADRYQTFRALLRQSLQHCGLLRIDHVMGLARQFWVPAGLSAVEGGYVRYPLQDLLGILALESRRAGALVVGEDLGVVPDGFRELMADNAVNRSQVLYFQQGPSGEPLPGAAYAPNALATVGTHDLPPIAGYWRGTDLQVRRRAGNIADDAALEAAQRGRDLDKAKLLALLRHERMLPPAAPGSADPPLDQLVEALHMLLAGGASQLVGVSLDDLTLEHESLNTPATFLADQPNWSRRSSLTLDDLRNDERIRSLVWRLRQRAYSP